MLMKESCCLGVITENLSASPYSDFCSGCCLSVPFEGRRAACHPTSCLVGYHKKVNRPRPEQTSWEKQSQVESPVQKSDPGVVAVNIGKEVAGRNIEVVLNAAVAPAKCLQQCSHR